MSNIVYKRIKKTIQNRRFFFVFLKKSSMNRIEKNTKKQPSILYFCIVFLILFIDDFNSFCQKNGCDWLKCKQKRKKAIQKDNTK